MNNLRISTPCPLPEDWGIAYPVNGHVEVPGFSGLQDCRLAYVSRQQDAEFICRAVNNHNALVAALQVISTELYRNKRTMGAEIAERTLKDLGLYTEPQSSAALAAATKGE